MDYISQNENNNSNIFYSISSTGFFQDDKITEGTQEVYDSNQITSSGDENQSDFTYEKTEMLERSRFYGFYFTRIIIIPYLIICIIFCLICLVIDIILLTNFGILSLISIPSVNYSVSMLIATICFNVLHIIIYIVNSKI